MPEATTKSLSEYEEGDVFEGEDITRLYASRSTYLIFEGNKSGVVTVKVAEESKKELRERTSPISPKIALITGYLTDRTEKRKYVDQIGLAYSEAIEGNTDGAIEICDRLIERIESYKSNTGRFYYLMSCLSITLIMMAFTSVLKLFDFSLSFEQYVHMTTYASIGGFLSVARGLRTIEINAHDFGWFQFFYGGLRMLISMFSGLIMYILIKSELILSNLQLDQNEYALYLIAIVAGFSESYVPNLLSKVEKNSSGKPKGIGGNQP
ncbi:hypothetical protein KFE98_18335 [bacterium SCSIO 12741]|nr:hypothetical protein KFE98_18335 [bacterium SCSIO 12741]